MINAHPRTRNKGLYSRVSYLAQRVPRIDLKKPVQGVGAMDLKTEATPATPSTVRAIDRGKGSETPVATAKATTAIVASPAATAAAAERHQPIRCGITVSPSARCGRLTERPILPPNAQWRWKTHAHA